MIYSIKRFSEEEKQDSGGGLGKKLLVGGALAATAFGTAKTGMLGNKAMTEANQLWAKGGQLLKSQRMVDSGVRGIGKATMKEVQAAGNFTKAETMGIAKNAIKDAAAKYAIPKAPIPTV